MTIAQGTLALALVIAGALSTLFWAGIDHAITNFWLSVLVLGLFALNAVALAVAGVTSLLGLRSQPKAAVPGHDPLPGTGHDPLPGKCAVLWLICGEPPEPLAQRATALSRALALGGDDKTTCIFILSDTTDPQALAAEKATLGALPGVVYRNRLVPTGRKPGNLRDWLATHGPDFETMLILDADSDFTAGRLATMRAMMARNPKLGLLQAGIALRPGHSRLARLQRLSARLTGPVFTHGLARLSGTCGNYWGHNALLRVAAFAEVAKLPDLPGRAPFGGPILSHDFIEAAMMRAAGWHLQILPDSAGSSEDAPETVAGHDRRDRRWAQGNLQHLRIVGTKGLHPGSRLHLLAGIHSYLSAPIWLALVLLLGSGAVHARLEALIALAATLALLLVPKLAGLARMHRHLVHKPGVVLRAVGGELALSTLVAPIWMMRRSGYVAAILAGRDAGWQPSGLRMAQAQTEGRFEQVAGVMIACAVMGPQWALASQAHALWSGAMVLPVVLPLLVAPWLIRWLNAAARPGRVAAYYDASTRRFLAVGGSGRALAIHRPLWADGITTSEAAAAHVNDLIARTALQKLGRMPNHVCDLGCGVGGTVFHLARLWPTTRFSGLTLSGEQVTLARHHAQAQGLAERCHFLQADFTQPTSLHKADMAIAIESHVHAASAREFLQAALAHLEPGGLLVVVDDMLADDRTLPDTQDRLIRSFRTGWRLGHVTPRDQIVTQAEALGYAALEQTDLSGLLHLTRLRDRALRVAGPMAERLGLARHALFANMIGGNALTESYRLGLMRYTMLTLRAPEAALGPTPVTREHAESAA